MEHGDLVSEMSQVEHLTTQERLHLARRTPTPEEKQLPNRFQHNESSEKNKRRIHQLKVWSQREKEWMRNRVKRERANRRGITFNDSVVLLEAAARNDIDEVRRLLAKGVTPDATNEDGLTALHQCCIDNNEAMMRLLLDHGANVNAEDSEKWTPLHAAATCGNINLVKILIQRGANLLAVNGDGNMPYDICEEERTLDAIEGEMAVRGITQQLIDETRASTERQMLNDVIDYHESGGDLDEPRDHQQATLLHIASANGYVKVVEYLLESRASIDPADIDLWRPTHAAACWGHLEVLELLVQFGADLNAKNKHDETPAEICEDPEVRGRLIQLAAEQEDARRRAAARHSLASDKIRQARRSSSTASSSRVRSVRRTSVREKALAAKTDARGEARMRESFDADQGFVNGGVENDQNAPNQLQRNGDLVTQQQKRPSNASTTSNQSYSSQVNGSNNMKLSYNPPLPPPSSFAAKRLSNEDNISYSNNNIYDISNGSVEYAKVRDPNSVRRAPEGQDNELMLMQDMPDGTGGGAHRHDSMVGGQTATPNGNATHYAAENNGKINVHVTVMINAGTLADLKKQRSQIRHSSTGSNSGGGTPNVEPESSLHQSDIEATVPRYTGHTADVVGDRASRRCCIVM